MKHYEPNQAGLAVNLPPKLTAAAKTAVSEYLGECEDFDSKWTELQEQYKQLHTDADDISLNEVSTRGAELQNALGKLRETLIDLRWKRIELLPLLANDFRKVVVIARRDLEGVIESERRRFASQGVTVEAMPAGNTRAGEIQLRKRIEQELSVMASKHRLKQAEGELIAIDRPFDVAPGWRGFSLNWPSVDGRYVETVNLSAGLRNLNTPPVFPEHLGYAEVASELGLANTFLPHRYREPLTEITNLVGKHTGARRVFASLSTRQRENMLTLLDALPQTKSIKGILARDAESPPRQPKSKQKYTLKV